MAKRYSTCPIVLVEWVDSEGQDGLWQHYADYKKDTKREPKSIFSVGYLVKTTEHFIYLVPTDSGHQVLGSIAIPKVAVQSVKSLSVGKAMQVR